VSATRRFSASSVRIDRFGCEATMRKVLLERGGIAAGCACTVLLWSAIAKAQISGPTPQPEGVPVAPEQAAQVERWAVHAQATNVWLLQPRFRSPYEGPQSLNPANNGRETVDVTLYAGVRP
jgi:high affinity Mn2+ porin